MTQPLLETVELATGPDPVASVVWLHGLGADGHDFEPIVPGLRLPDSAPTRFVFPHAPVRPVTINGGMAMRAWYDIFELGTERRVDADGILDSAARISALIDRERERGIPANRIFLAGFSQGGAMTLQVGLRHPEALAGLIVLSAYLPLADALSAEAHAANRATPVFQAHGIFDQVIPIAVGRRSKDRLVEHGQHVDWRTYPVQHGVHPDEVVDLGRWMTARLQ